MGWTSGEITQGVKIQPDTIIQKFTIANYCFPIIKATVNYILFCPELQTTHFTEPATGASGGCAYKFNQQS